MEGKDMRSKQKRKNLKHFKRHHPMKPEGAIQGIIESEESDDSDERAYGRKSLTSNWARYEEESEEDRFREDPTLLDFHALAQQPAGLAAHFQFSSEKGWGEQEEQDPDEHPARKECSQYFTINVNLLNAGLQTIPFYKRSDYDKAMFSSFHIQRMDAEAEIAENKYKTVLKEYEEKLKNPNRAASALAPKNSKSKPSSAVSVKSKLPADEKDDELDELLSMTGKISGLDGRPQAEESKTEFAGNPEPADAVEVESQEATVATATNPESKEDIQQWLDDILDE